MVLVVTAFAACGKSSGKKPGQTAIDLTGVNGDGSTVTMSVIYQKDAKMTFISEGGYVPYKALNDVTYASGKLKPAYEELQSRLNFTIRDLTESSATSASDSFGKLQGKQFRNINILNGPVSEIVDEGTKNNTFVDLNLYRKYLPNFFDFVDSHDIVKKSITSGNGAIYYSPYFDGFDDIETMFILRVDFVEKLLDDFANTKYDEQANYIKDGEGKVTVPFTTHYNGYYDSMDTSFTAVNADGKGTHKVELKYNKGEGIIAIQNKLATKTGKTLTEALVNYINEHYVTPGYITKPSELFVGQNACYNADELIALLRCVKTNPVLLTGSATNEMVPFFPRHTSYDRLKQILQLVQIWGVRGYDSRNGYLYIDENGTLQDARVSEDMLDALEYMHQLYEEGLIANNYPNGQATGQTEWRETVLNDNTGFMMYDYNQTTTVYNTTIGSKPGASEYSKNINLSPILFPVADWDNKAAENADGKYDVTGDGTLYQYTESWRSVKSEGWAITTATAQNPAVLKKCLDIFDYAYSDEGQRLMTYGPDEWIEHDANGDIVTIDYRGRKVPKISEEAKNELNTLSGALGNYTNYYRRYVGSTLPIGFVKEQGMEYQTVDPKGLVGLDRIYNAVECGVLKHSTVDLNTENVQNSLVPTTFALTDSQFLAVSNNCGTLALNFNDASTGGSNIFHQYIMYGFGDTAHSTVARDALVKQINTEWNLTYYMQIYRAVYKKMYNQ